MAEELVGNCLVAQSGGPTAVINASLAGVVTEALNHPCIEEIYGGLNGIAGVLNEDLIDLAEESQQVIRGLRFTPGSALGSSRYKMRRSQDFERALEVFDAHDIRYFFYIGGNDSQDTADKISRLAIERGYPLRVIGIPKTVDNDLVLTDHTPGYGSIIKYVATVVRELACDHASMGNHDLVSLVEVMGRNSGWVAAGAALAKRRDHPSDAPHLIYLPEIPFDPERFVADVQRVLSQNRYCLVVLGEGLVDENGNYLQSRASEQDGFGHAQLSGAVDHLHGILEEQLSGLTVRTARLGHHQRAAAHASSQADNDEAFMAGQAAVRAAVDGVTGRMITLVRSESDQYVCETGLADLAEVANGVKSIPENWINEDGVSMNYQFVKYAQPLIQGEVDLLRENGLPAFVHLGYHSVAKRLAPHPFE